jgi:hypothetical protein
MIHTIKNPRQLSAAACRLFRVPPFALLCGLAVTACQTTTPQAISQKEDHLLAAGFIVRPANTPERQSMLSRLPANHFARLKQGDSLSYVYADPRVCDCLYIGTQEAYDKWQAYAQQQHLADEESMAPMQPDAAWNWGKWGPWPPYPGFSPPPPSDQ